MNKLEEKIDDYLYESHGVWSGGHACAVIVTEFANGLIDWISENKTYKQGDGVWFNRVEEKYYLTTSAMIEEYIKTL